jgi:tRNA splicing endonuclease
MGALGYPGMLGDPRTYGFVVSGKFFDIGEIKLHALNDIFLTIAEIYHFAAESTSALGLKEHRVRVDVAVSDNRAVLKDGYKFDAKFTTYRQKRVLAVPNSAIFKTNDLNYVLKAQKNRAVLTSVRMHQTNTETVIRSGVARNDQIIFNANTEGLADGTKIAAKEKRR